MRFATFKVPASFAFLFLAALTPAYGTVVYNNTVFDTGGTLSYVANPFAQLGDQILLGGTDRLATLATVQFFDDGGTGSFDATLRLFQVGLPVGPQLGSDYTVTGIAVEANSVVNVSFALPYLPVPDELIFTVSVANPSGVHVAGLDTFEPPTVGSSDNTFAIGFDGSSYSQIPTSNENVFFSLEATPEPSGVILAGGALVFLARRRTRR